MKFCERCFKNEEIRNIIQNKNKRGNCDIDPEHKDVFVCKIVPTDLDVLNIKNILHQIIDVYTVDEDLPADFPNELRDLLRHTLKDRWSLFEVSDDRIQKLLQLLFAGDQDFDERFFDHQIGVIEENECDNKSLIIQNNDWESFIKEIKYKNRFHTKSLALDNLAYFLGFTVKSIAKDQFDWYRCRISNQAKLDKLQMGAPPRGKATAGRLNPEWISMLYLCDNADTCIKEVRAGFKDTVYVGKFKLTKDIRVIDLRNFADITLNGDVDNLKYYLNRKTLCKIAAEFAKPTNNNIKRLEYLPLQYISEYIKSLMIYDGIIYKSVMDDHSFNLVLFDPSVAKCTMLNRKIVNEIDYKLSTIA